MRGEFVTGNSISSSRSSFRAAEITVALCKRRHKDFLFPLNLFDFILNHTDIIWESEYGVNGKNEIRRRFYQSGHQISVLKTRLTKAGFFRYKLHHMGYRAAMSVSPDASIKTKMEDRR